MAQDATFEDGAELPVRLLAQDADDVSVVSTLVQDAVAQTSDMVYERGKRRFTLLLNRFRWEDKDRAQKGARAFERVQSLLSIEGVERVQRQDVDPSDPDLVLSLLSVGFEPKEEPGGRLVLTFSGDGALALDVECIEVQLKDVSRPYLARASDAPSHPLE